MSAGNPLIATANSSIDPWAGVWIAEDIETIYRGVKDGSWIEGSVSAGLDALAFVSDPVGALLQYGVAWIIEHVEPLREALDWLAGNPAQIQAHAQTWKNVAGALQDRGEDLNRAVGWDTTEWTGSAADAYRTWTGQQRAAVDDRSAESCGRCPGQSGRDPCGHHGSRGRAGRRRADAGA